MLAEILLGALVLTVAFLVAVDFSRTKDETPHGHADESPPDVRPRITRDTRGRSAEALLQEPADAHDAGPARRPESISPPVGGYQHSRTGTSAAPNGVRPELKKRHVRSRLLLLVTIPAVAVTVIALCVGGLIQVLQGARIHSSSSSTRDGAILSAVVIGVVMIVVLVLAAWFAIATARSVLQPIYRLRVRALEVAGGRRPGAARGISENEGQDASADPESFEVNPDEIGDVARAFNQMRGELLRMAANEIALRGKLDGMFVNMSHRSQSLVERQISLIENLEHSEQDRDRLAHLSRINRIATRMHRNSQNLLVLAGHELSIGWNQPMALLNVIRAAVSEVEEYERVSLHEQPDIVVSGPVVNDAVHLLAELTENATSFSAVDMPVEVSGYLMSSGVVIDITDRGVGMSAKELAYANWRLENPPTGDIDVPKWIGLFVVARLAARHGIKIRLQQAEFGGLTALVWLPAEIIMQHAAAAPTRLGGSGGAVPRRGSHEAVGDLGRDTVDRSVAMARSAELTSPRQDARGAQLGRRLIPDASRQPGLAGSADGARPVPQVGPPGAAEPSRLGSNPLSGTGTPQVASVPFEGAASLNSETHPADGGVIVPPAETRRLPIFDSLEARWFSGREVLGSSGVSATAGSRWSSPADEGARAAATVDTPIAGAPTSAGLPKRLPNANLVPGAIPNTQPVAPLNRSAPAARDRFAGFQRGASEGRTVASEVTSHGSEDES